MPAIAVLLALLVIAWQPVATQAVLTVTPTLPVTSANSSSKSRSHSHTSATRSSMSLSETAFSVSDTLNTSFSASSHSSSSSVSRSISPSRSPTASESATASDSATSRSPSRPTWSRFSSSLSDTDSVSASESPTESTISMSESRSRTSVTIPLPLTPTFEPSASMSETLTPSNTTSFRTFAQTKTNTTSLSETITDSITKASVSFNETLSVGLTDSRNTTSASTSFNGTYSEGNVSITPSLPGPYNMPTAVYYSYEVISAVFLVKARTFFTDKASFDYDSFAYDLFDLIKTLFKQQVQQPQSAWFGWDPNLLSFLTESVALRREAMPLMVCNVDRSIFSGKTYINTTVCKVPSTCSSPTKCIYAGVESCTCIGPWSGYPANTFVNLSTVPDYPGPTAAPTATPTSPSRTLSLTAVNNEEEQPSQATKMEDSTSGAGDGSGTTLSEQRSTQSTYRDRPEQGGAVQATTSPASVQVQLIFRVQFAPAFHPSSVKDVQRVYAALRNATSAALKHPSMLLHHTIDGASVDTTAFYEPPSPPAAPIRVETSTALLPILAVIAIVLIFAAYVIYRIVKYVRWRLTVDSFHVKGEQSALQADDREMADRLGQGHWLTNEGGTTAIDMGDDPLSRVGAISGNAAVSKDEFDPLRDLTKRSSAKPVDYDNDEEGEEGGARPKQNRDEDDSDSASSHQPLKTPHASSHYTPSRQALRDAAKRGMTTVVVAPTTAASAPATTATRLEAAGVAPPLVPSSSLTAGSTEAAPVVVDRKVNAAFTGFMASLDSAMPASLVRSGIASPTQVRQPATSAAATEVSDNRNEAEEYSDPEGEEEEEEEDEDEEEESDDDEDLT